MTGLLVHYRKAFFEESRQVKDADSVASGTPRGLVGRQVANADMLHAILRYGHDSTLTFLVHGDQDAASLKEILQRHLPGNKKAIIKRFETLPSWFASLPECVLWQPQPPSAMFAWMRARLQARKVAIGGITHALCSELAIRSINDLVASPTTSVDRIVCTSEAVAHTTRCLIEHAANLSGRELDPELIELETIPLGVDCKRHRPASAQQRENIRARLRLDPETRTILFVGRLSHHAKSNPLPLFAACQRASRRTGQKVALILAGWYANDAVKKAFEDAAIQLAPDVRVNHVNAMDPQWRDAIWAAADIFVSLADSVQETFGLTVVEAMSRRLPVIATDWNGYRESVQDGQTGLLIPTAMIQGAAERSLQALHEGHLSYDQFLATAGQAVRVDPEAAAEAITELVASQTRCDALAQAGYKLALDQYDWPSVITRYEELWERQRTLLRRREARGLPRPTTDSAGQTHERARRATTVVPSFRKMFALYPSRWIDPDDQFQTGEKAFGELPILLRSPLANHVANWRREEPKVPSLLQRVCEFDSPSGHPVDDQSGSHRRQRQNLSSAEVDTIAWAFKYDLIRTRHPFSVRPQASPHKSTSSSADVTLITTCMGRLEHLQQSLPRMVAQESCEVVVVDFSCPQNTADWVRQEFGEQQVRVVSVTGRQHYDRSESRNRGLAIAQTPWVAFVDADMLLSDDFSRQIHSRMRPGCFLRCTMTSGAMGRGGLIVAARNAVEAVNGYDPVYCGWGEEDEDLVDALIFHGQQLNDLPDSVASHIDHDDDQRAEHHQSESFRDRWLVNRVYRMVKWDLAKQLGRVPSAEERTHLYQFIEQQIAASGPDQDIIELRFDCRSGESHKFRVKLEQAFSYRIMREPIQQ